MGKPHKDNSQDRLQRLFAGHSEFLAGIVKRTLHTVSEKAKIEGRQARVLDIGAGGVPYWSELIEGESTDPEWIFLDRDIEKPAPALRDQLPQDSRWISMDFFDLWPDFRNQVSEPEIFIKELSDEDSAALTKRFDLIILSATVHELYYDAVREHVCPLDFHKKLFTFLRQNLLNEDGSLLVADYAWPSSAKAEHVYRITELQEERLGHADPPWAFKPIATIQRAATEAGFQTAKSRSRGLFDRLTDDQIKAAFEGGLEEAEIPIIRQRLGFAIVLRIKDVPPAGDGRRSFRAVPNLAATHLTREAEIVFQKKADKPDEGLNRLFTSVPSCDSLPSKRQHTCETLGSYSVLTHLVDGVRAKAQAELSRFRVADAGIFELWINLGLRHSEGQNPQRFVPRIPIQWKGSRSSEDPGPESEAGVLSVSMPDGSPMVNQVSNQPLAGPVAIAFRQLKGKRSLHRWISDLHKNIRDDRTVPRDAGNGVDQRQFKSLTLISQDYELPNNDRTCRSIYLSSLWGGESEQADSGHYVTILPCPSEQSHSCGAVLCEALNKVLSRIARNLVHGKERPEGLPRNYEGFLSEVFYPCIHRESKEGQKCNEYDEFLTWWRKRFKKDFSDDSIIEFPRYRSLTILAVGCDGQSLEDPDTLILFSSQAWPSTIVEDATSQIVSLARRINSLETQVMLRRSGQSEQLDRNLGFFGHDSARLAEVVGNLLKTNWRGSRETAFLFSRSLEFRSASYSRIIGASMHRGNAEAAVIGELKSVTSHVSGDVDIKGLTDVRRLFLAELLPVVARLCVSERTAQWGQAARMIFNDFPPEEVFELIFGGAEDKLNFFSNLEAVMKRLNKSGLSVEFKGPVVMVPTRASGERNIKTTLLHTGLRFVFSEILTNVVKHQWHPKRNQAGRNSVSIYLETIKEAEQITINLVTTPALSFETEWDTMPGLIGLDSLRSVISACGMRTHQELIQVGDENIGEYPVPIYDNANNTSTTSLWIPPQAVHVTEE